MVTEAEQQQWQRNKAALDNVVAELVKAVAEVGEAKMASEAHIRDADNFKHAQHHRKVAESSARTFNRAVEAYVRLRQGPQPD